MKKKQTPQFKILIPVVLTTFIVVLVSIYAFLPKPVEADKSRQVPRFVFDSKQASGWWTSGSIDPRTQKLTGSQSDGSDVPFASIGIYQGKQGESGDCSILLNYWGGRSKDLAKVLSDLETRTVYGSSTLLLKALESTPLTMKVSNSDQYYQLHQYDLTGSSSDSLQRGIEFGVIKTATGYIDIRGNCKTADELTITLPVLSAVSLEL